MKEAVTVSQLNKYIKDLISEDNILRSVYVKGEVSNLKESKGNYYFALKDSESCIQCIVFTNYSGSGVNIDILADGREVLIKGKIAVYEKGGSYSIYVSEVSDAGLGDYYVKLETLKNKLYEMGMFDESYKKSIPTYSMNIGVVTAKNGAAIKDIYVTIKNKNPYANVILYPSLVQGEFAFKSIIDGIMTLDNMNLDVIIIGRGGGSVEDLYVFNDERVAYAIFNARTPIISAVGHEINDTIADLVADVRVATPTAAGELATFSFSEFVDTIENYKLELDNIIDDRIESIKDNLNVCKDKLQYLAPKSRISRYKEKIVSERKSLNLVVESKLSAIKITKEKYCEMLKGRNVLDRLSNGFSYVTNIKQSRISSIKNVRLGEKIYSRFKDGVIESAVTSIDKLEV